MPSCCCVVDCMRPAQTVCVGSGVGGRAGWAAGWVAGWSAAGCQGQGAPPQDVQGCAAAVRTNSLHGMPHAGVLPQWDLQQTIECAQEVEKALRKKSYKDFLANMYGNTPNKWSNSLKGYERLRVITNALTRIRFCTPTGTMEFESKEGFENGPKGYIPWFKTPKRKTQDSLIYFGHWSTLGLLRHEHVIGRDTGCVWGGKLTAMEIPESGKPSKDLKIIQVDGYDHPLRM